MDHKTNDFFFHIFSKSYIYSEIQIFKKFNYFVDFFDNFC